jgi:hypothetical protein
MQSHIMHTHAAHAHVVHCMLYTRINGRMATVTVGKKPFNSGMPIQLIVSVLCYSKSWHVAKN